METPVKFTPGRLWATWSPTGRLQGFDTIFCFSESFVGPVGIVWGVSLGESQGGKSGFEVYHSFVLPWARRVGVRDCIQKALFEDWKLDFVTTQKGTAEGMAWMRRSGYRLDKRTGHLTCTRLSFYKALAERRSAKHKEAF